MRKETRHGEEGAALVAVLCLLATAGVLVLSLAALSQSAAFGTAEQLELMRSRYRAEGMMNRIRYLIEADRSAFSGRRPEDVEFSEYDHDRYFGDGYLHEAEYYGAPVRFVIHNAVRGIDLNSGQGIDVLLTGRESDTVLSETLERFRDRLDDYTDNDDAVSAEGMEQDEYDALDRDSLPRNASMQFKEELFWIPGALEVAPPDGNGELAVIRNLQIRNAGNPSIYAASYIELRAVGGLEETEAAAAYAALREWRRSRTKLGDQLDVLTLPNLQQNFSWQDSAYYTVEILHPETGIGAGLRCTFRVQGIGGPSGGIAPLLEYAWF